MIRHISRPAAGFVPLSPRCLVKRGVRRPDFESIAEADVWIHRVSIRVEARTMLAYRFDPLVEEWFEGKFGSPTEPQHEGWKAIGSGQDVLISAPTGSGKTLAAFLICLDRLVKVARTGGLADRTVAVYISPLKALSSDIARNLEAPLAEIRELAGNGASPSSPSARPYAPVTRPRQTAGS